MRAVDRSAHENDIPQLVSARQRNPLYELKEEHRRRQKRASRTAQVHFRGGLARVGPLVPTISLSVRDLILANPLQAGRYPLSALSDHVQRAAVTRSNWSRQHKLCIASFGAPPYFQLVRKRKPKCQEALFFISAYGSRFGIDGSPVGAKLTRGLGPRGGLKSFRAGLNLPPFSITIDGSCGLGNIDQ